MIYTKKYIQSLTWDLIKTTMRTRHNKLSENSIESKFKMWTKLRWMCAKQYQEIQKWPWD